MRWLHAAVDWGATRYASARYEYDVQDRLTDVYGPGANSALDMSNHIEIGYDALGRKTEMDDPDMGAWAYRYDAAGNLIKQRDARNQAICFYYDELNRLVGKTYHANVSNLDALACSGSYAVSYSYDSTANGNKGVGRRTGMSDGSGSTTWVYDARGRVTRETKTITGAGTFVTQWTYDAMDRVQTMTYPDGEAVTTTYNAQGPARALSSTVFGDIVIDSAYNAANQPTERRLGTGGGIWYKQLFDYNPNTFRLTSLKAGNNWGGFDNLINMSYAYDAVGNVVSITDAAATGGAQTQSFKMGNGAPGYDELNRLKRAQATGGSYGVYGPYIYNYEPNGNVTQFQGKGFAYNDPTHKHALTHVDGAQKYWYDENGNMTRRISSVGDHTLAYDAENRLTSITQTVGGGFVASYVYDGDGVRVKEQKGNYTRYFVGDYYEIEGSIVRKYYSLGGARVAESYNGVLYFLLADHLGSTALTTARTGGRVGELRYYPFGVWRYKWGSPKTSYRYTGQRWDSGTGLYWYRSRWYDPEIGRFIQPDTIVPNPGDPQALNRYAYVRNNPLRYTDPTGFFSEEQLVQWFGENWRDLFSDAWQAILWLAEFGDAVVYGDITAVFVEQDRNLVGWNISCRSIQNITDIANSANNGSLNLYRPWSANPEGGPSAGNIFALGEMTSPEHAYSYQTNVLRWIYGDDATHAPLVLPPDWYRGPTEHVRVKGYFAGWDVGLPDVGQLTLTGISITLAVWGGKKLGEALLVELGGPAGAGLTILEIASWTTWDTSYQIAPGSGTPPPVPVPVPPAP